MRMAYPSGVALLFHRWFCTHGESNKTDKKTRHTTSTQLAITASTSTSTYTPCRICTRAGTNQSSASAAPPEVTQTKKTPLPRHTTSPHHLATPPRHTTSPHQLPVKCLCGASSRSPSKQPTTSPHYLATPATCQVPLRRLQQEPFQAAHRLRDAPHVQRTNRVVVDGGREGGFAGRDGRVEPI